jgi:hypothetical protein
MQRAVTFKQRTKLTDDAGCHGPLYTAHHLGSPEILRGQMSKDDQPKSTTVRLKFAPQPSSNEERPNDPQVIDHSGHPQPMAFSGRLKRSTVCVSATHHVVSSTIRQTLAPPKYWWPQSRHSHDTILSDGDSLPSIRIGNSSLTLPRTDRRECFSTDVLSRRLLCSSNVTFTVLIGVKRADTATHQGIAELPQNWTCASAPKDSPIDSRFQAG